MKRFSLLVMPLVGSCFFLIDDLAPDKCDPAAPAVCEANALVTCESGVESRVQCGAFACNAALTRCGDCGDGFVDIANGEICDDGNNDNGDGCREDCTEERCGDTIEDPQEACDDGNFFSGDGCSQDCLAREVCGNNIIDVIASDITVPADAVVAINFEYLVTGCNGDPGSLSFRINDVIINSPPTNSLCQCDPGIESFTETSPAVLGALTDGNNTFSVESELSDGILMAWVLINISTGPESVDVILKDGSNGFNGGAKDRQTNLCASSNFNSPFSFSNNVNGVSEFLLEECDDGNFSDGDGCSVQCVREFCGDGIVNNFSESCDDGNQLDGDACPSNCVL